MPSSSFRFLRWFQPRLFFSCGVTVFSTFILASTAPASAQVGDVLTQHNDAARTGAQLQETVLTPANVTPTTFGRLYQRTVAGQIIAQPLYVNNLNIPGLGVRNVVYVVTQQNMVYAFDADSADTDPTHGQIWSQPIAVEPADVVPNMCAETVGPVGVTSTPVIDRSTNTMYLVARNADHSIWLHALDITTGAPKGNGSGRTQITATASDGLSFMQDLELQRPGLLLDKGAIVMGFAALNCDNAGWHGWVLAYRASDLTQVGVFPTTSKAGYGGGVWQSGTGLAADASGNIYFETGNGTVSGSLPLSQVTDLGMSFVKLSLGSAPTYGLTLAGRYTLPNWAALNAGDTDLGSGGPVLLPGNRLVGGGKQGKLYVLNPTTMLLTQNTATPGTQPPGGSDGFQAFVNTWHDDSSDIACMDPNAIVKFQCYVNHARYENAEKLGPNIHTGLIYWNGRLIGMPEKDYMHSYAYNPSNGALRTKPLAVGPTRPADGMPGAALSLSANGANNGIVWAAVPKFDGQFTNIPAYFAAYDAVTLKELWRDDDDIAFAKFNPPTIAGGKVFRPTFANSLIVYGLKTGATPIPCYTIAQLYQNYAGANGVLKAADGPETTLPDGVGRIQTYNSNTNAIVWSPTTCAHELHGGAYSNYRGTPSLGYPLTNEIINDDGVGTHTDFQNGSSYSSQLTQPRYLQGPILAAWLNRGAEQSALGYPISYPTPQFDGSGTFSLFEHGAIYLKNGAKTPTIKANPARLLGPQEGSIDRNGSDNKTITLPTASATLCQERCKSSSFSCVAWTYVAPNTTRGPKPLCFLKNAVPQPTADSCCVSGVMVADKPSSMSAIMGDTDQSGGDFASFKLFSFDARLCQGECAFDKTCKAWTYRQSDATCFLKSTKPTPTASTCCASGRKN